MPCRRQLSYLDACEKVVLEQTSQQVFHSCLVCTDIAIHFVSDVAAVIFVGRLIIGWSVLSVRYYNQGAI